MLQKFLFFCLLFISLTGCRQRPERYIFPSYYYWKTTFELTGEEKERIKSAGLQKLYVRYFDVDWNARTKQALPVSPVRFKTSLEGLPEVIPTVYITNKTILNLPAQHIPELGNKILAEIRKLNKKGKLQVMQEIQLDCDWTESTRKKYFSLITHLKKSLKPEQVKLSVTIRLHQIKYASRTGIPPADKGMLMFYNMGNLKNPESANSIYNQQEANKYLVNFEKYPLPLDVALPAFSWAVLIRNNKTIGLLNNVRKPDFDDTLHYRFLPPDKIEVKNLLFMPPHYLYPGDVLKLEEITPEATQLAARQIAPYLKADSVTAALYHWDLKHLNLYKNEDLEAIFNSLH